MDESHEPLAIKQGCGHLPELLRQQILVDESVDL